MSSSNKYGKLLIEGKNLVKDFPITSNSLKQPMMRAINDVSFKMYKSRGLAVVGESGSGKSTTAKMIAKMYAPTAGMIEYKGRDIQEIKSAKTLCTIAKGFKWCGKIRLIAKPNPQHFSSYCASIDYS